MLPVLQFLRRSKEHVKGSPDKHAFDDPLDREEWYGLVWIIYLGATVRRLVERRR